MSDPIHFVCVLRTGGAYNTRYVNNLYMGLVNNVKVPFTFTVLTNNLTGYAPNIRVVPLTTQWQAWWSKIEMFKPGLWTGGRVWYLDLDTLILSDMTDIVLHKDLGTKFFTLSDFIMPNRLASGVMSWRANDPAATYIYESFAKNSTNIIDSCSTLGDQCWIGITLPTRYFFQTLFPKRFVSFKRDCSNGTFQKPASVCCFHGLPRPHEAIKDPASAWVRNYWK